MQNSIESVEPKRFPVVTWCQGVFISIHNATFWQESTIEWVKGPASPERDRGRERGQSGGGESGAWRTELRVGEEEEKGERAGNRSKRWTWGSLQPFVFHTKGLFFFFLIKQTLYSFYRIAHGDGKILYYLEPSIKVMWETWVRSLSWEDSLEKRMATHSSILDWRIPWTV